jgi:hypothetical protein
LKLFFCFDSMTFISFKRALLYYSRIFGKWRRESVEIRKAENALDIKNYCCREYE